jgi:hypothetical protein
VALAAGAERAEAGPASHRANPAFDALGDNTALDLGPFTCTVPQGDGYPCRSVTDYSGFVYDPSRHRLLMFGGGHATTFTDAVFEFDPDTLLWSERYAPTPCTSAFMSQANFDAVRSAWKSGPSGPYPRPISRHTYDLLAVAAGLPELILLRGPNGESGSCPPGATGYDYAGEGRAAHYDLNTDIWSFSATAGGDGSPYTQAEYTAAEYDPISGKVVLLGRYGLYVYDPVTRVKTRAVDNYNQNVFGTDLGYANHLVYYPPDQRMYYFDRNASRVVELTLDRSDLSRSTIRVLATTGPYPPHQEPGYAYDGVSQVIGGAVTDDLFYVFDPRSRAWTSQAIQGGAPGTQAFHALAYDPVDNVFLFLTDYASGSRTWAYRYRRDGFTPAEAPAGGGVAVFVALGAASLWFGSARAARGRSRRSPLS